MTKLSGEDDRKNWNLRIGPYTIIEKSSDLNTIKRRRKTTRIHANRIKTVYWTLSGTSTKAVNKFV